DLDDAVARPGQIRQAESFCDHAVEPCRLEPFQPLARLLRIARDRRELKAVGPALELGAALLERQLVHRLALPEQDVEGDVARGQLVEELCLHGREGNVCSWHRPGRLVAVSDLDGFWRVERVRGLLPPLYGVRKRIEGDHGETRIGPLPGLPFRVDGLTLKYH